MRSSEATGRRVGIVFSGGISKCAYQVGFLKSLLKFIGRDEIAAIAGASCGVFTAYALSANKLGLIEWMYKRIDTASRVELAYKVGFKDLLGDAIGNLCAVDDKLDIPVYFPISFFPLLSVRYYKMLGVYNPVWSKYMTAATNFPFLKLFPNVIRGRLAFDGGAVDNIPLFPLLRFRSKSDLGLILILHFDARYDYRRDFLTDIPTVELDLSICNGFKKNHFDFSRAYVDEMISRAETYGDGICRRLFCGEFTKERLTAAASEIFLDEHAERMRHSSADGWLSTLNRIGKKLRGSSSVLNEL